MVYAVNGQFFANSIMMMMMTLFTLLFFLLSRIEKTSCFVMVTATVAAVVASTNADSSTTTTTSSSFPHLHSQHRRSVASDHTMDVNVTDNKDRMIIYSIRQKGGLTQTIPWSKQTWRQHRRRGRRQYQNQQPPQEPTQDDCSNVRILPVTTTTTTTTSYHDNDDNASNASITKSTTTTTTTTRRHVIWQTIILIRVLCQRGYHAMILLLRSTFLPSSYPHQMPSGYRSFVLWSWIQDVSTQFRSVIATQRVLLGVGVGRSLSSSSSSLDSTAAAVAWSALYNFMIRDGCGMVASLSLTSLASSYFDRHLKQWRLFADVILDIGITLEVLAMSVPSFWFLPMICLGNMCKAMCGVAAGACSGAIHLYWATPPTVTATPLHTTTTTTTLLSSDNHLPNDNEMIIKKTKNSEKEEVEDPVTTPKIVVHDNEDDCHKIAVPLATKKNLITDASSLPNIADIQAKFQAQHTVTASLGLVMAAWFAKVVSSSSSVPTVSTVTSSSSSSPLLLRLIHGRRSIPWGTILYIGLTVLHVYANMKCMRTLALTNLNPIRMDMVIDHFLHQWWNVQQLPPIHESWSSPIVTNHLENDNNSQRTLQPHVTDAATTTTKTTTTKQTSLSSPSDIAKTEPLFFFQRVPRISTPRNHVCRIQLGLSFPEWWNLVNEEQRLQQQVLLQQQQQQQEQQATTTNNHTQIYQNVDHDDSDDDDRLLQLVKTHLSSHNYLLAVLDGSDGVVKKHRHRIGSHYRPHAPPPRIVIALGQNVTARQMVKAYLQAHVVLFLHSNHMDRSSSSSLSWLQPDLLWPTNNNNSNSQLQNNSSNFAMPYSYDPILLEWEQSPAWQNMWQSFETSCEQAGWNLDVTQLPTLGYRIAWSP